MRIPTHTNSNVTIARECGKTCAADTIRIELPNGTSVCIDLLETPELGVFGSVWVHNDDSTIREHVTF